MVAEFLCEFLTEFGLGNAGGPEAEAHGEFFRHCLALLVLLRKKDAVGLDFLDTGVGKDIYRVMRETSLVFVLVLGLLLQRSNDNDLTNLGKS